MTDLREIALTLANGYRTAWIDTPTQVVERAEVYYAFLADKRQTGQNVTLEEQITRSAGGVGMTNYRDPYS